jgi:hypothetical protein
MYGIYIYYIFQQWFFEQHGMRNMKNCLWMFVASGWNQLHVVLWVDHHPPKQLTSWKPVTICAENQTMQISILYTVLVYEPTCEIHVLSVEIYQAL